MTMAFGLHPHRLESRCHLILFIMPIDLAHKDFWVISR